MLLNVGFQLVHSVLIESPRSEAFFGDGDDEGVLVINRSLGGGAALLFAPLVLQLFPDPFVDGRAGLLVLATLAVALTWSGWALTRF